MPDDLDGYVEDQIQQAFDEGKFDNLPGTGKPFRWDPYEEHPYVDADRRMAHHMLKEAGYSLPWIDERREIEAETDYARRSLLRSWRWRQSMSQGLQHTTDREWEHALTAFRERIKTLNERILTYNLKVPNDAFMCLTLNVEREIAILTGESQG